MIVPAPMKAEKTQKPTQTSKSFLADALQAKLKQLVYTDDGRQISVAQMMAERLTNIAMYAESNADSVSASKLIYERVLGKAAVMKEEDTRTIPKVVFTLSEDGLDKVNKSAEQIIKEAEIDDNGEALIVAEVEGRTFVG